jgi:CxxC motif-containing protein (DUF1111 family)
MLARLLTQTRLLTQISIGSGVVLCTLGLARAETTQTPLDAIIGQSLFERVWVSAPASTKATDGLGPLFNARSCAACHPGGGRAEISLSAQGDIIGPGLVARFTQEAAQGDPFYGRQLQSSAVQGRDAEGKLSLQADGVHVKELTAGPLHPHTHVSGRIAPQLHGLAHLAALDPEVIAANADPEDKNKDGISGRVHWVRDATGGQQAGRFGWRAAHPSLTSQSAEAFLIDLGLSTSLFPSPAGDCTTAQTACLESPHGDPTVEIPDSLLTLIIRYLENLSPPKAQADSRGEALFSATGCAACHIPRLVQKEGAVPPAYTDLLLHDMGEALASPALHKEVAASEWRTAPLWGMGQAIAQNSTFLHDGRAATIRQAIEFHGGEALSARQAFETLSAENKQILLTFVETR